MSESPSLVPEGFFLVRVTCTAKEYRELRAAAALLGEGTVDAALRVKAGYPESPSGIKAARLLEALAENGLQLELDINQ